MMVRFTTTTARILSHLHSPCCKYRLTTVPLPNCRTSSKPIPAAAAAATTAEIAPTTTATRRKTLSIITISLLLHTPPSIAQVDSKSQFFELDGSGGVKALELRTGNGASPLDGDEVAIHYYGRLAAKQGWRFDSTYDHKDYYGEPIPFVFTLGSGKVIPGIEAAVRTMKVGSLRRVIIPPSQGYQNTTQEPIPPDFFDRQRLFTTIFNPTRLANGEGSTLGTLIFDIELVRLTHPQGR